MSYNTYDNWSDFLDAPKIKVKPMKKIPGVLSSHPKLQASIKKRKQEEAELYDKAPKRTRTIIDPITLRDPLIQLENKSWMNCRVVPDEVHVDEKIFQHLLSLKPTERATVKIYGKEQVIPRWQRLFGPDYQFAGKLHKGEPFTSPYLKKLLEWVCNDSDLPYTQCIMNWYMDGTEYLGAHSDNEAQLVAGTPVYSFSFGSTRDFVVTKKKDASAPVVVIPMHDNTLIIMGGEMQQHYKHEVPKRLKVKEPRINITFRVFK